MNNLNESRVQMVEIILDFRPVGSLVLYTVRTPELNATNAPIDSFYWRDDKSPQGFGPFTTPQQALNHHISIHKAFKSEANPPGKVIAVDFQAKRRIL